MMFCILPHDHFVFQDKNSSFFLLSSIKYNVESKAERKSKWLVE